MWLLKNMLASIWLSERKIKAWKEKIRIRSICEIKTEFCCKSFKYLNFLYPSLKKYFKWKMMFKNILFYLFKIIFLNISYIHSWNDKYQECLIFRLRKSALNIFISFKLLLDWLIGWLNLTFWTEFIALPQYTTHWLPWIFYAYLISYQEIYFK